MRFSSIQFENRFFIRKRLRLRKNKKMCSIGHIFFLILYLKNEEKYLLSPDNDNRDFFTVSFLKYSRLNWESNLCYFSICFHFWKRSDFRNTQSYLWILLFLSGDLELNPGPFNYHLNHPSLCGYYRAAIFSVLKREKLLPRKDKDGKDILEKPDFDEGLNDLKTIFGDHYAVQQLDWETLMKNKNKFLDLNTNWGKNRKREDRSVYYKHFSTVNWVKLDDDMKKSILLTARSVIYPVMKFMQNSHQLLLNMKRIEIKT